MMDVVIVSYNTRDYLRACLASLRAEPVGRVVVVDNASTDGSPAMVQAEFPEVLVCANQANPGYGAAANQALALCPSPYALVLNSDTRLQPGALAALGAYLDAHPQAAVVGPRLLNPDGSPQLSCYAFPTPLHVFLEESTLIRGIGALPGLREAFTHTQTPNRSRRVDWVLGAVLALRRAAVDAVHGFDAAFFLYAEEVDLSYRLRQAGWQTHFTPEATVVHVGGASTRQRRAAMTQQFIRSLMLFYQRHYSPWRQAQLLLIVKGIVLARWGRDLARLRLRPATGQQARLAEDIAGWRQILRGRFSPELGAE